MGYRHIENLYKNKEIFLFKQCYASEKIDGTSAHISYSAEKDDIKFFSGGSFHDVFVSLFNKDELLNKFRENSKEHSSATYVTFYGEAYGGKIQKRSSAYGPNLKFIVFEVMIVDNGIEYWMSVPQAERLALRFGFEFVPYRLIETTEEAINAEMMADSVQAVRNGMGTGHMREGVVLRPSIELIHPNGGRIIAKHKRPEFSERKNEPKINDPQQLKILEEANEVADEFVCMTRLEHVLDKIGLTNPQMENTKQVIEGMIEDVYREGKGEFVESDAVARSIGKKAAKILKDYIRSRPLDPTEK